MSRTWYTVPSCSTTLPFLMSEAFMEGPGVGNRESGVGSRESGVGNRESGIGNRESGKHSLLSSFRGRRGFIAAEPGTQYLRFDWIGIPDQRTSDSRILPVNWIPCHRPSMACTG